MNNSLRRGSLMDQSQLPKRTPVLFVLFLYFCSGLISLVLQIILQRKMIQVFGGTVYSTAIVISAWMAGLAIGSYLTYRVWQRIKNHLAAYCYTQIALILYSIFFSLLFLLLNLIDQGIFLLLKPDQSIAILINAVILFMIAVIPAGFIGAGFPFLAKVLGGKQIPLLYAVNALGSVLGALLTGFILLPALGIAKNLFIISGAGLFLNLFGLWFAKSVTLPAETPKEEPRLGNRLLIIQNLKTA